MKKVILTIYFTITFLLSKVAFSQSFSINRYESEIKAYEAENKQIKPAKDVVVLYGSSSFRLWKNYVQDLAPYNVINRGFGGSTVAEALHYFDRAVLPLKPKVIFFYEGENDLPSGFSVDSTFALFLKMRELIQKKLPDTKFVPLSVKRSPSRKAIVEKQKLYNGMVRGIAMSDKNMAYIDIVPLQLTPQGTFDPDMFMPDSLHVSEAAYKKWAVRMKHYLATVFPTPLNEKWIPLFNGKNLDGWEQKGGNAKYEVIDGVIVGTSALNTPNSFLCTQKMYSDFVLEFEVKVDTLLNSGVQFRSNSRPEYRNGVVHGYQCEIDPSPRAWSAGIYDEQRRGWIYKPEDDPYAKMAFNRYGWNKYRIEAIGTSIKTYLNGRLVTDIIDTVESSGFIGLQVHSITQPQQDGTKVMWRNIRIWER